MQLRFPIRECISKTDAYRAATLRGASTEEMNDASGLDLVSPDEMRIGIHRSPAGPILVLAPTGRADFVALVRPVDEERARARAGVDGGMHGRGLQQLGPHQGVPASMGGRGWRSFRGLLAARVQPPRAAKSLYQDRFLILSDGPYSNVTAGEVGLSDEDWRRLSTMIRLEHECTHYFTLRVFGSMRNNLLDELIADYMGITAAPGRYRSDWFLRFMGLESFPAYREGGRLQNYRGRPPLSEGAFKILGALVRDIGENLQSTGDDLEFLPGSQEERAGILREAANHPGRNTPPPIKLQAPAASRSPDVRVCEGPVSITSLPTL